MNSWTQTHHSRSIHSYFLQSQTHLVLFCTVYLVTQWCYGQPRSNSNNISKGITTWLFYYNFLRKIMVMPNLYIIPISSLSPVSHPFTHQGFLMYLLLSLWSLSSPYWNCLSSEFYVSFWLLHGLLIVLSASSHSFLKSVCSGISWVIFLNSNLIVLFLSLKDLSDASLFWGQSSNWVPLLAGDTLNSGSAHNLQFLFPCMAPFTPDYPYSVLWSLFLLVGVCFFDVLVLLCLFDLSFLYVSRVSVMSRPHP